MADVNHVVLIGRLTRDSELRYTQNGTPIVKFSIAVNRRKKTGEEWVEEVSFFDVVFWGKMGESINQYLVKGKQVAVTGELRQNRWEQDGQPRSKVEIVANNLQLLGLSQGSGKQQGYQSADSYSDEGQYQKKKDVPNYEDFGDDDSQLDNIPF